jgi:riboflavin synthase
MFTGIIEEVGSLERIVPSETGAELQVRTSLGEISVGDSVAVDGCCLTATSVTSDGFTADASQETLRRTTLAQAQEGQSVNLERALAAGSRMGGHVVQGHVDGVGHIEEITPDGEARIYRFAAPEALRVYFAEKGSVAIDGISLTVNDLTETGFTVTLIPHTLQATTLGAKPAKARVNLETDVLAKYVVRTLAAMSDSEGGIDPSFLKKHGFM